MNKYIKRNVWIAATLLCCLMLALPAQAASFDCAKASTKVEHLICDTPEISKLDDELGASYRAMMKNEKHTASINKLHKKWLKSLNDCVDADCVLQHYKAWLPMLSAYDEKATAAKANKPRAEEVYRYGFYKAQYEIDFEEQPSNEELAARPFCEAVIAALNKTNPTENYRPCISEEVLKLPGVADPAWEKLDLSKHEELAKKILALRVVGIDAYFKEKGAAINRLFPNSSPVARYPSSDQLQHLLEERRGLGAELFALKLPLALLGDKVLITLRYKDAQCGMPSRLGGEHADVVLVNNDLKEIATPTLTFDPMAARPILYQGKLYLLHLTRDGLDMYVPHHEIQSQVCSIEMSIDYADKKGDSK